MMRIRIPPRFNPAYLIIQNFLAQFTLHANHIQIFTLGTGDGIIGNDMEYGPTNGNQHQWEKCREKRKASKNQP